MNNIFNTKRFGIVLSNDLLLSKNNFGLSLLICGTMPAIIFLIYELFYRIIMGDWGEMNVAWKVTSLCISYLVVIFNFGPKVYGHITEKRAGTSWLLTPASTFEKWLSTIVVSCVVLPLCFAAIFAATDGILSLIFNGTYGESLVFNRNMLNAEEFGDSSFLNIFGAQIGSNLLDGSEEYIRFSFLPIMYMSWTVSILTFVLGAVFFKKSKVGKTFLALMAVSMVISSIESAFLVPSITDGSFERLMEGMSPTKIIDNVNLVTNLSYILSAGLLMAGIYYRYRTIKH